MTMVKVSLASLLSVSTFAFSPPLVPSSSNTHTSLFAVKNLQDEILSKMTRFFGDDMVDSSTNRFYYYCLPFDGERQHVHFPIRDLAAAWDATKALEFTYSISTAETTINDVTRIQQQLKDAVRCTLAVYSESLSFINEESAASLNQDILLETPNIGHSALLLLGTGSSCRCGILEPHETKTKDIIDGLARGILSKQLSNGAFSIHFGDSENYLAGIEFFPGEAMLALIHALELSDTTNSKVLPESTRQAILQAMETAFDFYSNHYCAAEVDINYNIWQALAFARHYDHTPRKQLVAKYVMDLGQEICHSKSWKYELARGKSFYVNLETVEIACGLDALAEGIRIARIEQATDVERLLQMHATNAVYFLQWAQDQVPSSCTVGRGGLGYGGIQVLEQRLDVTGHAISALTKLRSLSQSSIG